LSAGSRPPLPGRAASNQVSLGTVFVDRAVAIGAANVVYDVSTGGQRVTGSLPVAVVARRLRSFSRRAAAERIVAADVDAQRSATGKAPALRPRS
jgi:hypothetical protein